MSTRTTDLGFYLARVIQAREEGEAATLDHVRERCRRSEAAWSALAARAERSAQLKAAEAMRKADEPPKDDHEINNDQDGRTGPQAPAQAGQDPSGGHQTPSPPVV